MFDPELISYEEILKLFWENHDPTQSMRQGNDVGTQYRSAVYTTDSSQVAAVEATNLLVLLEQPQLGVGEQQLGEEVAADCLGLCAPRAACVPSAGQSAAPALSACPFLAFSHVKNLRDFTSGLKLSLRGTDGFSGLGSTPALPCGSISRASGW